MKETYIKIPVNGNLEIHGTLRGNITSPLIILCPGLGGWMHDLQMFNASRYFEKEGYSSLRISFYGHDKKQRNITDFGVKDNASDIDSVVEYARKNGAKFVAVVGHSFSGLAIAYSSKQEFDTGILWDPTHTDGYEDPLAQENLKKDYIYSDKLKSFVSGEGPGYVLSNKVFEEYDPGSTQAISKFRKPLLVINADENEPQITRGLDYVNNCPAKSKQIIIPDSSHSFTEDGALDKLYKATFLWIEKIRSNEG